MMNDYDARQTRTATFDTVTLPAIAVALAAQDPAAGWVFQAPSEQNHQRPRVVDGGITDAIGAELWFRLEFQNGAARVAVHGSYPQMPDGSQWYPGRHEYKAADVSITVGADRDPAAIAREIVRRFLPDYRIRLGWAAEDIAKLSDYHARTRDTFALIAAAAGDGISPRDRGNVPTSDTWTADVRAEAAGAGWGSFRVSGASVRIEIDCTPAFAVRVAQLLNGGR